jgi:glutathione peroxidase
MGQEPGSEEDIQEFCTLTYGVKFPMFEKVSVKGGDATPLYRDLAAATGEKPGWNFHKYLVDRNGEVVASFGSRTKPDDPELVAAIEELLAQPAPAEAGTSD